jgi:hypothetical protein
MNEKESLSFIIFAHEFKANGGRVSMTSKRVYLFLTGGLLLLSIGTGFAMQDRHSSRWAAVQALETASLQLHRLGHSSSPHQAKAMELIHQAIAEMKADLATERPGANKQHSTG